MDHPGMQIIKGLIKIICLSIIGVILYWLIASYKENINYVKLYANHNAMKIIRTSIILTFIGIGLAFSCSVWSLVSKYKHAMAFLFVFPLYIICIMVYSLTANIDDINVMSNWGETSYGIIVFMNYRLKLLILSVILIVISLILNKTNFFQHMKT